MSDRNRYPYSHHGPPVYGSKLADYLISEMSLRQDRPDLALPGHQPAHDKRDGNQGADQE